ncbi:MAG: LPS export ABC transporter periplasmic protein LptC [Candidatus Kapabacteria bacterium]|nr:LPS export ABC transporter periplasmic protein LptC [Candidatus Kapabacteria bacterium]
MFKIRNIIKTSGLIALFLFMASCIEWDSKIAMPIDSAFVFREPDQSGTDVEVIFADSGYTKAILKAKKGRVYQDNQETFLDDGMTVDFFSKFNNERISHLKADSARIDDVTKNMLARGNVVVISDSIGNRLETSVLEWNNSTQKIYSNEFVKITTKSEIITGYGFVSDQNLDNYKINKVSGISYRND